MMVVHREKGGLGLATKWEEEESFFAPTDVQTLAAMRWKAPKQILLRHDEKVCLFNGNHCARLPPSPRVFASVHGHARSDPSIIHFLLLLVVFARPIPHESREYYLDDTV